MCSCGYPMACGVLPCVLCTQHFACTDAYHLNVTIHVLAIPHFGCGHTFSLWSQVGRNDLHAVQCLLDAGADVHHKQDKVRVRPYHISCGGRVQAVACLTVEYTCIARPDRCSRSVNDYLELLWVGYIQALLLAMGAIDPDT